MTRDRFSLLFNLCLWFHDAVYDPRQSDNEVKSKDLFNEFALAVGLPSHDAGIVEAVILDTIKHKIEHGPMDDQMYIDVCQYFLDADLGILCADQAVYESYAERIWLEYSFVGRETYCEKRPLVLEKLISSNPFSKDPYKGFFVTKALINVNKEISLLRNEQLTKN